MGIVQILNHLLKHLPHNPFSQLLCPSHRPQIRFILLHHDQDVFGIILLVSEISRSDHFDNSRAILKQRQSFHFTIVPDFEMFLAVLFWVFAYFDNHFVPHVISIANTSWENIRKRSFSLHFLSINDYRCPLRMVLWLQVQPIFFAGFQNVDCICNLEGKSFDALEVGDFCDGSEYSSHLVFIRIILFPGGFLRTTI